MPHPPHIVQSFHRSPKQLTQKKKADILKTAQIETGG
jgi:hypothetical protein